MISRIFSSLQKLVLTTIKLLTHNRFEFTIKLYIKKQKQEKKIQFVSNKKKERQNVYILKKKKKEKK